MCCENATINKCEHIYGVVGSMISMETGSNRSVNMEDDEARCSYYSLVSRLDQLGFIMKYLERNQNMGARSERASCVPLDLAAKEASIKGSLLDRVTSLEHRLFQLCLEMESSSLRSLLTTCDQNNPSTQLCSSFPIFRYPNDPHKQDSALQPNQGKSQKGEEKQKKNSSSGKAAQPRKMKRGEKVKKKEAIGGTWPRLRMLGC